MDEAKYRFAGRYQAFYYPKATNKLVQGVSKQGSK
jgi:hypothetical protein